MDNIWIAEYIFIFDSQLQDIIECVKHIPIKLVSIYRAVLHITAYPYYHLSYNDIVKGCG